MVPHVNAYCAYLPGSGRHLEKLTVRRSAMSHCSNRLYAIETRALSTGWATIRRQHEVARRNDRIKTGSAAMTTSAIGIVRPGR